jgi:hypothetical protein
MMCAGNKTPPGDAEETPLQVSARQLTHTELALLEFSKQVLIKSTETSLDFHKTMLGISATFGTLITTVAPILIWGDKDAKIPMPAGWLLLIPSMLMLLSAIVFALGYYPRYRQFNPNLINEIRLIRENAIKTRKILAGVGLGLFCSSLLLLSWLVIWLRLNV